MSGILLENTDFDTSRKYHKIIQGSYRYDWDYFNRHSYQSIDYQVIRASSWRGGHYTQGNHPVRDGLKGWKYALPYGRGGFEAVHKLGSIRRTYFDGGPVIIEEYPVDESWYNSLFITDLWQYDRGIPDSNAVARATTECLNKIGNQQANLSVDLAEAHQTVNLLSDAASTLLRLLLAVKNRDWGSIPRAFGLTRPNSVGNRLLEYRFGWKPLADDLFGISSLALKTMNKSLHFTEKKSVGSRESVNDTRIPSPQIFGISGTVDRIQKVQLTYDITVSALRAASQLGLTNPASFGWEVIPYSFVVDWMLPIGHSLQALTDILGCTFVDGFSSTRSELNVEIIDHKAKMDTYPSVRVKGFSYERSPLVGFPVPQLYVKSPFTSSHTETALALLAQTQSGKGGFRAH